MSTYKELIYIVSDLAKQQSDDTTLTERHIAFLLNKYRSYLLKQKYLNKTQEIPLSNYQTICADMTLVPAMPGCTYQQCMDGDNSPLLRSIEKVDLPLTFSDTKVSLLRCPGMFTLGLYVNRPEHPITYTADQLEYILQIIPTLNELPNDFIRLFGEKRQDGTPYYIKPEGGNMYVFEPTLSLHTDTIVWGYNPETKLYQLEWENDQDFIPLFPAYATTCSEDVNTIIDIFERRGISAKFITLQLDPTEGCNEETFYTNAMRQYGDISVVGRERFNYVGYSRYYKAGGYATIGVDSHLYIKSENDLSAYATTSTAQPQVTGKALVTAIFESPDKAYEHSSCTYTDAEGHIIKCPNSQDGGCDPWDREFPIEDALQTQLIALTLKDVYGASLRPKDNINNANDDLSSIEAFVRNAMKQRYTRDNAVDAE